MREALLAEGGASTPSFAFLGAWINGQLADLAANAKHYSPKSLAISLAPAILPLRAENTTPAAVRDIAGIVETWIVHRKVIWQVEGGRGGEAGEARKPRTREGSVQDLDLDAVQAEAEVGLEGWCGTHAEDTENIGDADEDEKKEGAIQGCGGWSGLNLDLDIVQAEAEIGLEGWSGTHAEETGNTCDAEEDWTHAEVKWDMNSTPRVDCTSNITTAVASDISTAAAAAAAVAAVAASTTDGLTAARNPDHASRVPRLIENLVVLGSAGVYDLNQAAATEGFEFEVVIPTRGKLGMGLAHLVNGAHGQVGCKVTRCVEGGSAAATGQIEPHDWIIAINEKDVSNEEKETVIAVLRAAKIEGETATLRFRREEVDSSIPQSAVAAAKSAAEKPGSQAAPPVPQKQTPSAQRDSRDWNQTVDASQPLPKSCDRFMWESAVAGKQLAPSVMECHPPVEDAGNLPFMVEELPQVLSMCVCVCVCVTERERERERERENVLCGLTVVAVTNYLPRVISLTLYFLSSRPSSLPVARAHRSSASPAAYCQRSYTWKTPRPCATTIILLGQITRSSSDWARRRTMVLSPKRRAMM